MPGNIIYHHRKLLQSIENQKRDGIAEGPLLSWLIGDHVQLLKMSKFVLLYFQTVRIPFILGTDQEQGLPRAAALKSAFLSLGSNP